MTGQTLNDRCGRWVLVELNLVVLDVDIVADAKELLAVLVGACEQDGGHTDDIAHGQLAMVRGITLHASKSKKTKSQWERTGKFKIITKRSKDQRKLTLSL